MFMDTVWQIFEYLFNSCCAIPCAHISTQLFVDSVSRHSKILFQLPECFVLFFSNSIQFSVLCTLPQIAHLGRLELPSCVLFVVFPPLSPSPPPPCPPSPPPPRVVLALARASTKFEFCSINFSFCRFSFLIISRS